MNSSKNFQTSSILLLTATLVCIGLAITVIAPIIDSPLARSSVAQTDVLKKVAGTPSSPAESLAEFYPSIAQAHHQWPGSSSTPGTAIRNIGGQRRNLAPFPQDSRSTLLPAATPTGFSAASPHQNAQPAASRALTNGTTPSLPPGSVYAPITIHQPTAATQALDQSLPLLTGQIERLVTERERLAASLVAEKERQSQHAQQEQQQRQSAFQQQHIARLESELKSLSQSMVKLQAETSTKLSRLAEHNSQIDIASQALTAYRQALEVAKAEAAESAERHQAPRTAQLNPESAEGQEQQSNEDDAGRVRIPDLPPMPTYQHQEPDPTPTIEQPSQTAETPFKRLRVSSPGRTFREPEPQPEPEFRPEPEPQLQPRFLPLPTVDDQPDEAATAQEVESSLDEPNTQPEMQMIPLEAPKIQDFQSNLNKAQSNNFKTVPQPAITPTVPDLNMAFEGKSEPRVIDQTSNRNFQFETIEFPDLSVQKTPQPQVQVPQRVHPVSARVTEVEPKLQVVQKAARTSESPRKSWGQKLSGSFTQPATEPETSTSSDTPSKVAAPSRRFGSLLSKKRQPPKAHKPTTERPGLLQRISHTFRGIGRTSDR